MSKEVLYVCMAEDRSKELFLVGKQEVEKSIKNMEENPDVDLDYNVLGGVDPNHRKTPYLISYKISPSNVVLYDVVYANEGAEAHSLLLSKKRLQDKSIKITNTLDLTKLIQQYYE